MEVQRESHVEVCPDTDAHRIREYIRTHPDVRKDEYTHDDDPLHGSCYVAAEAYFHAKGGIESGLDIYCLSWRDVNEEYDGTHWYLGKEDVILDISLPTPEAGENIPWDIGRRRAFLTGYEPSKRARGILDGLDIDYE